MRVYQRDGLVQAHAPVRRQELPGSMLRISYGDPRVCDDINIFWEAFDVAGFEVKRIVGEENAGIWAALDFNRATDIMKDAVSGFDVVMSFVGFDMLVLEI